jgi:hypothetical protein
MSDQQQPLDLATVKPGAPERGALELPEGFAPGTAAVLFSLVSRVGHELRAVKFEPINPLDVHGCRTAAGEPLWRVTVQRKSGTPLNVIRSSLHAVCVATLEELAEP